MTNKTIKQKTEELNKLVEWFDSEDFEVEKAIGKYKQAKKLADEIKQDLDKAKLEIEEIN